MLFLVFWCCCIIISILVFCLVIKNNFGYTRYTSNTQTMSSSTCSSVSASSIKPETLDNISEIMKLINAGRKANQHNLPLKDIQNACGVETKSAARKRRRLRARRSFRIPIYTRLFRLLKPKGQLFTYLHPNCNCKVWKFQKKFCTRKDWACNTRIRLSKSYAFFFDPSLRSFYETGFLLDSVPLWSSLSEHLNLPREVVFICFSYIQ